MRLRGSEATSCGLCEPPNLIVELPLGDGLLVGHWSKAVTTWPVGQNRDGMGCDEDGDVSVNGVDGECELGLDSELGLVPPEGLETVGPLDLAITFSQNTRQVRGSSKNNDVNGIFISGSITTPN